jgi:hypothetical protein
MFSDFADWIIAGKFRVFKLGRPAKLRSPTSVISRKLRELRFWRLFRPKVPPIDWMLSAEIEVTLVAPVAVRSPVILRTLGKLKSPAASVAMARLPAKVLQEDRALASAGLTTVRVADALHWAVETCVNRCLSSTDDAGRRLLHK